MNQCAMGIETREYIALVMAIRFLTFYALPDGVPFLARLATMVATQYSVGRTLRREERREEK